MAATGSRGSQDEHKRRLILTLRKEDTGLEHILHIRRVGPGDKGLTYQAWDSLLIYHYYSVISSKCYGSYTQRN